MNALQQNTAPLCNAYIYGATWDGQILLQGQLTERMAWEMRLNEKRNRTNKSGIKESYFVRAAASFDLFTIHEDSPHDIQHLEDKILKTWIGYAANTKKFKKVKFDHFQTGIHFILFGWKQANGATRIRTSIITHPEHLSQDNMRQAAISFMNNEAVKYPETLPPAFLDAFTIHRR